MIANYGYKDGSGEYYISINTDKCVECSVEHACVSTCPQELFEIIEDDYDDEVAAIKNNRRSQLAYDCADCKPSSGYSDLPCTRACTPGAIVHSW